MFANMKAKWGAERKAPDLPLHVGLLVAPGVGAGGAGDSGREGSRSSSGLCKDPFSSHSRKVPTSSTPRCGAGHSPPPGVSPRDRGHTGLQSGVGEKQHEASAASQFLFIDFFVLFLPFFFFKYGSSSIRCRFFFFKLYKKNKIKQKTPFAFHKN